MLFFSPARHRSALFMVALGASCALAGNAGAATFAVSNNNDSGAGSLRQAVLDANVAPGADLVDARRIRGVVRLQSALPDLSEMTIVGPDARELTIFGGADFRVFTIANANVTLANFGIWLGHAERGGGVFNGQGKLTLQSVIINNNSTTGTATGGAAQAGGGGGLYSSGPVVARDCVFAGNRAGGENGSGGAIFMEGAALELKNCEIAENNASRTAAGLEVRGNARVTISGGSFDRNIVGEQINVGFYRPVAGAGSGAAVHLSGATQVLISGTNFDRNRAGKEGGALWNGAGGTLVVDGATFMLCGVEGASPDDGGGAIYNDGGTLTVRNSTLQNNYNFGVGNGGAIVNKGGVMSASNSRFTRNAAQQGGAIETVGGQVTLNQTDFTGNFAGNGNVASEGGLGNGGAVRALNDARVFVNGGVFQSNGATLTGGALWNGNGSVTRVDGTAISGNTAAGEGGGALYNDGGVLVVRNAQLNNNAANGAADGAAGGVVGSGGAIFNNGGRLELTNGSARGNSANRAGGAIESNGAAVNFLSGVTLADNVAGPDGRGAPGNGGALHVTGAGRTFIARGSIANNKAQKDGGGLWISSEGRLIVDGTNISGNDAAGNEEDAANSSGSGGGGIYGDGGVIAIRNATLTGNTALAGIGFAINVGKGGGLLNKGGALQVTGCTFAGNASQSSGGAIATIGTGGAVLQNSIFRNNSTRERISRGDAGGGAFHMADADTVFIVGSTFEGNSSLGDGGALANRRGGTFNITSSIINNNELPAGAGGESGGIYNFGGTLNLRDVVVSNNKSSRSSGGGITNVDGTLIMRGGQVSGNSSQFSGGGIQNFRGKVTLTDVTLSNNSVSPNQNSRGGALDSSGFASGMGSVLIVRGEISNNSAGRNGGGLYSNSATLVVDGTSIVGNKINGVSGNTNSAGDVGGGGIYNRGGALTVRNARLESNEARIGGAILNSGGAASITNTILRGNKASGDGGSGGAISSIGSLVIGDSTLQDNQAPGAGGAIDNEGDLTLLRCTLSGNRALTNGGALHTSGAARAFVIDSTVANNSARNEGGGLWNSSNGTLSVRNSTLDGNSAGDGALSGRGGGGIYNNGGFVSLDSVTVTSNKAGEGGGLFSITGPASVLNSVIALNTAGDGTGFAADIIGFSSKGYNLIGVPSSITARTGDLFGTAANLLDPKLGALGNNGGPTQTRLPQSGSPLINAGGTGAPADQRGIARPQGARKDIGAVEVAAPNAPSSAAQSALRAPAGAPSGGSS